MVNSRKTLEAMASALRSWVTRCGWGTRRGSVGPPPVRSTGPRTTAARSPLRRASPAKACGMLHLSAAEAAGARADRDTAAIHLQEASALAARMDTEVGTFSDRRFGPTNVAIWETEIATTLREPGQALEAASPAHPEPIG